MIAFANQDAPDLLQSAAAGLRPPPDLTVSEWADRERYLTSKESPEPGRWRTDRAPYLREIMDVLSDRSRVQRVVVMKSSQVGGTEVVQNWLGYAIQHSPGPMLAVQPTVDIAKRYSKQRLTPLLANSPALRQLVKPSRSRDSGNTQLAKEFPGGILLIGGANSAAALRSMPIGKLALDEVDAYPPDVDGEGDPCALAERRTANFLRRKILYISTPTIEDFSRIEAEYEASDQRHFWVPCPDCKEHQILVWEQVQWPDQEPEHAQYVCPHCGSLWDDLSRRRAVQRGEWRAEHPERSTAGFHVWAAYSPWVRLGEMAIALLKAKKDPELLKVFVNTVLGQTWKPSARTVDHTGLLARREPYPASPLPEGVALITAGVDVQDDRVELEVVGWGRLKESWSLEYRVVRGDPSVPALWAELDLALLAIYERQNGVQLRITATCVDTMGHHTQAAYRFCKARWGRRVWAIRGVGGPGRPVMGKPSRNNKGKVALFPVGVDAVKDAIYSRLKIEEHGEGFMHFPDRYGEEHFRQLTAEKVKTVYVKGHPTRVWVLPAGRRNEALDCRVYATAAYEGLSIDVDRLADELDGIAPGDPPPGQRRERRVRSEGVQA